MVIAEGELRADGAFHARALGFPPAEHRNELPMAAQVPSRRGGGAQRQRGSSPCVLLRGQATAQATTAQGGRERWGRSQCSSCNGATTCMQSGLELLPALHVVPLAARLPACLQKLNLFGGRELAGEVAAALEADEASRGANDRIVVLANVWLDQPDVIDNLHYVFRGACWPKALRWRAQDALRVRGLEESLGCINDRSTPIHCKGYACVLLITAPLLCVFASA